MLVLLRIAGDCAETSREAVECTGKSPEHIKEAVVLYLKQILLFPDANSYRVLGVDPQEPHATIREHLHWMMRWLHPDRNRNSWDSAFASRVLSAWEDLKSPQRRQGYDHLRDRTTGSGSLGDQATTRRPGVPWVATPLARRQYGQTWLRTLFLTLVPGFSVWRLLSHKLFASADEAEPEKASCALARANDLPGEPKDAQTSRSGN